MLTTTLKRLGRVVAYYPNLKKITGSTTATILLCQFLYWTTKSRTGWIYKTTGEIEEETGLTLSEQKTAKEKLINAGLIFSEYKRLDHTTRYMVNQDVLDGMWSELETDDEEEEEEIPVQLIKGEQPPLLEVSADLPKKTKAQINKEEIQKIIPVVKKKLAKGLTVNPVGAKWTAFIKYASTREYHHGESVDVFITYLNSQDTPYNPIYMPPAKLQTLWPRAFVKTVEDVKKANTPFIKKAIPVVEETEDDFAPMPEGLGRRRATA